MELNRLRSSMKKPLRAYGKNSILKCKPRLAQLKDNSAGNVTLEYDSDHFHDHDPFDDLIRGSKHNVNPKNLTEKDNSGQQSSDLADKPETIKTDKYIKRQEKSIDNTKSLKNITREHDTTPSSLNSSLNKSKIIFQSILPLPHKKSKIYSNSKVTKRYSELLKVKSKKIKLKPCCVVLKRLDVNSKSVQKKKNSDKSSLPEIKIEPLGPRKLANMSSIANILQPSVNLSRVEETPYLRPEFNFGKMNLLPLQSSTPIMSRQMPRQTKNDEPIAKRSRSSQRMSRPSSVMGSRRDASEIDFSGDKTSYFEGLGLSKTPVSMDRKTMTSVPLKILQSINGLFSGDDDSNSLDFLSNQYESSDFQESSISQPENEQKTSTKSFVICNPITKSPLKNVRVVLTHLEDFKENKKKHENSGLLNINKEQLDFTIKSSFDESNKSDLNAEIANQEADKNLEHVNYRKNSRKSKRVTAKILEEDSKSNVTQPLSELRVSVERLPSNNINMRKRKTVTWNVPNENDRSAKKARFEPKIDENDEEENSKHDRKVILKPNKHWRRSLLAFHHVQQESAQIGNATPNRENKKISVELQDPNCRQTLSQYEAMSPLKRKSKTVSLGNRLSCCVVLDRLSKKKEFQDDPIFLSAFGIHINDSRQSYVEDLPEEDRNDNARKCILSQANQEDFWTFTKLYKKSISFKKIGEGLYGEVFSYKVGDKITLLKIIPVEGDYTVNGEEQKQFQEVITEVVTLQRLHKLCNEGVNHTTCFTELKKIRCLKGKYPKSLVKAWEDYDKQKKSENDHPSCFQANQRYLIIEMGHGGQELDNYSFYDAKFAFYAFMQIAYSLAAAESEMEFEHRDLHLGNVLVKYTDDKNIHFCIKGRRFNLPTHGIKITIIDNTLSRCRYGPVVIYNNLENDPTLFESEGCEQFDVYRRMRKSTKKDWRKFTPVTNILWLEYILFELKSEQRYQYVDTNEHREHIQKINSVYENIRSYESALSLVTGCPDLLNRS